MTISYRDLLRFTLLPAIFGALLFAGCSGSKKGGDAYLERIGLTTLDFDREIEALSPELIVNRTSRTNVYLGILASGSEAQPGRLSAMSTIESASFVIIDNDGDPVDSLYTDDVQMSGLGGTEGASILAAGTDWTLDSEVPESFTLITIVRADDRVWVRQAKTTLPIMEGLDPIQLDIEIEELGEGKLRLTLLAHRVDDAPVTERLPNGEKFRLTIFDGYNPIWSSSDGKVFTSAIEKVEPQDIGDREEWVVEWEGSAKSGDLTIEGRIPAAPSPYVVRKGYRYGGR